MSSLRNSVKRKTHKERAQPADRKKYGLLEKHKDYVLRAKDFHRKEDAIRTLKEKAALRNPDEFYFKMVKSRTQDGVHQAREDEANKYSQEELILMRSQDLSYVLNKAQAEAKKVERLRASLHSVDEPVANRRILFTDDRDEAAELGDHMEDRHGTAAAAAPVVLPKSLQRKREAAYRELEQREQRLEKMRRVMQKMALRKELMGKGRKQKVKAEGNGEPGAGCVYKWKKERKK